MPLKRFFLAISLVFFCAAAVAAAEPINIYFKSSPRFEILRPFADPASLSVLVTGADGRPLDNGDINLNLDAPSASRYFSTDYPVVEGSRLLNLSLPLSRGRAEWKYLLPIRGQYRLSVEVRREGTSVAAQIFDFSIRENSRKWFLLSGFLFLLFSAGVIAGRIFTGVRAHTAILVLALLGGTWLDAHETTSVSAIPESPLEIASATVGKLSRIRWRATASEPASPTTLSLTITHLEKGQTVFAVDKLRVGAEFSMDFQFADGAEHRVRAVAEQSGRPPIQSEQLVNVTGVEPPVSAMARALALFVATIAAGLLVGRWSKKTQLPISDDRGGK